MESNKKILLIVLYGLIALMVIFSILAIKNTGKSGFDSCHQEKCEKKGDEYCNKFREINNCCLGAGGKLVISNNKPTCSFS